MADQAVLRIVLDPAQAGGPGGGGGAPAGGGVPGGGAPAGGAGGGPIAASLEALQRRLQALHDALDPTVIRETVRLQHEIRMAERDLRGEQLLERHAQGFSPVDLTEETIRTLEKLAELQGHMRPEIVEQWANAAIDVAEAEQKLAALRAVELERLAPMAQVMAEPLTDLAVELGRAALEIERLNEALDPDVIHQRAELEIARQDAAKRAQLALESEMERLAPTVTSAEPPDFLEMLTGLAGQFGGRLGRGFGRVAGAFGEGAAGTLGMAGGVGAAYVAALAVVHEFQEGISSAVADVGHFGAAVLSASADTAQSVHTMGEGFTKAGEAVFVLNPGLSVLATTAGAVTQALSELMAAIDGLVDRYAQYSPGLAQAEAQAEVTQVVGDLRRSQQVAPDLVRYVEMRTELQQKFEEAKIRILERLMPSILDGMQALELILPYAENAAKNAITVADAVANEASGGLYGAVVAVLRILRLIKDAQKDKDWELFGDWFLKTQPENFFGPGGFGRPANFGPGSP